MKPIILLWIFFISCSNLLAQTNGVLAQNTEEMATANQTDLFWSDRQKQDSLRNEILKLKENNVLKTGFLQELYIRNAVTVSNDTVYFNIPFDLHAPDCGVPDCYSTDISFHFKLGATFSFPKHVPFTEFEHGCVDKPRQESGEFELIEHTDEHVIYHASTLKKTLVLFSSYDTENTTALYYTNVERDDITRNTIRETRNRSNAMFKEEDYPFMSWILSTNDYSIFLQ